MLTFYHRVPNVQPTHSIWLKARFAKLKSPAIELVHDINKPAQASRGLRFFITDVIICTCNYFNSVMVLQLI